MNPRSGWRRVLVTAVVGGVLVTAAATGLGLLIGGAQSAAGAAIGGGAAVVLSGITLTLIDVTERRAPRLSIPVFFAGFAAKLVLLGLALLLVSVPRWMDPGWTVLTAAAVVATIQVAAVISFRSMRLGITPGTEE